MPEEKKIYVDEDWKSRVEEEKEQQRAREATQASGGEHASATEPSGVQMPPASFEMLLTTLATEAMVALGQIAHPATGKAETNLDHAKYFIDTLDILQQKTKGNLTASEAQALEDVLYQLRMAFVTVGQRVRGGSKP